MMSINYHQQAPPSLTFASPLAKTKLSKWIRVVIIRFLKALKQLLKSTYAFKQKFSSELE
jgi:hypothetical protein